MTASARFASLARVVAAMPSRLAFSISTLPLKLLTKNVQPEIAQKAKTRMPIAAPVRACDLAFAFGRFLTCGNARGEGRTLVPLSMYGLVAGIALIFFLPWFSRRAVAKP